MFIKKFVSFIWQLPQNLLALLIMLVFLKFPPKDGLCKLKDLKAGWTAISLGWFILYIGDIDSNGLKHEQGHQKQSLYLGPLYLIAVGIPSMILAIRYTLFKKSEVWYHSHYPENWADKLGGSVYK